MNSIKILNKFINIIKISNNRFITYCFFSHSITLFKLNENYLFQLKKKEFNYNIKNVFILNKDIIIPNFDNERLQIWKINEDNELTRIFHTNLQYSIQTLLKYDNILLVYTSNFTYFIDINNYHIIKQIENLNKICCMTNTRNGNILFGVKGNKGYDIIEYKFNKSTCDLTKLKAIFNAHYSDISHILGMSNGNIISYENYSNFIVIWNGKNEI